LAGGRDRDAEEGARDACEDDATAAALGRKDVYMQANVTTSCEDRCIVIPAELPIDSTSLLTRLFAFAGALCGREKQNGVVSGGVGIPALPGGASG
jgi:hypothetical protein